MKALGRVVITAPSLAVDETVCDPQNLIRLMEYGALNKYVLSPTFLPPLSRCKNIPWSPPHTKVYLQIQNRHYHICIINA